jgi:hypothetical protein
MEVKSSVSGLELGIMGYISVVEQSWLNTYLWTRLEDRMSFNPFNRGPDSA